MGGRKFNPSTFLCYQIVSVPSATLLSSNLHPTPRCPIVPESGEGHYGKVDGKEIQRSGIPVEPVGVRSRSG
jgi:hypothetical protein